MERIQLSIDASTDFINEAELTEIEKEAKASLNTLIKRKGKGKEFLGWLDLPLSIHNELENINLTAEKYRKDCEAVVVIGIGGSYLGARAVIDAMNPYFGKGNGPEIIYAGHHLSEIYLSELIEYLEDKTYGIIVVSKSGTTTEPAIAFRLLKNHLESKLGKEKASYLITAITDGKKGALKQLATKEGYQTFVIPDDVGGRYSVLSPVGLLPIAIAGHDIFELINGAETYRNYCLQEKENDVVRYAAVRNYFYRNNFDIEIMVNYEPKLFYIAEWWKQLFGESEGKEHKGIFPSAVNNTTDLHSLGQYIQEGQRFMFETVLSIDDATRKLFIPEDKDNLDKLNYLSGRSIDHVNKNAEEGTRRAHLEGGVPNLQITLPKLNEYFLGQLIYFFELACGVSGYTLGVNPFDQPGVEAYKKNMFDLLGKNDN